METELTALQQLEISQSTASSAAIDEQHDVEEARPRIALCILEAWDAIEYKHRRLDAPAMRAIAREWGVTYASRPGETPEVGVNLPPVV